MAVSLDGLAADSCLAMRGYASSTPWLLPVPVVPVVAEAYSWTVAIMIVIVLNIKYKFK